MAKKDWDPKRPIKQLEAKAIDNHGFEYNVHLALEKYLGRPAWVLVIEDTPGRWYMATILEEGWADLIWIDYGQRWSIVNFIEIMREAITLV